VRAQEPSTVIGLGHFEALAQKGSKIRLLQSQLHVPSQVPASRPQLGDIELDVELGGQNRCVGARQQQLLLSLPPLGASQLRSITRKSIHLL
jgi:hypothetical protein